MKAVFAVAVLCCVLLAEAKKDYSIKIKSKVPGSPTVLEVSNSACMLCAWLRCLLHAATLCLAAFFALSYVLTNMRLDALVCSIVSFSTFYLQLKSGSDAGDDMVNYHFTNDGTGALRLTSQQGADGKQAPVLTIQGKPTVASFLEVAAANSTSNVSEAAPVTAPVETSSADPADRSEQEEKVRNDCSRCIPRCRMFLAFAHVYLFASSAFCCITSGRERCSPCQARRHQHFR